jgi:hypothetical protein
MLDMKPVLFGSGCENVACVFVILSENVLLALVSPLVCNIWAISVLIGFRE